MKKINWKMLLVPPLVFLLILALSGCEEETVSESKCGENGTWVSTTITPSNDGYCSYDGVYLTEEEILDEIGHELHDFVVVNGFDTIIDYCDNADTPDDIGGLGDTDCDEMVRWYADNWEELYDFMDYFTADDRFASELDQYLIDTYQTQIDELQSQIDDLETTIGVVAWEINITNIMYGEFVGINAYGDCSQFCRTYAVIEVDGVEYETNPFPDYTYTMGERVMVIVQGNGVVYSIPLESEETE